MWCNSIYDLYWRHYKLSWHTGRDTSHSKEVTFLNPDMSFVESSLITTATKSKLSLNSAYFYNTKWIQTALLTSIILMNLGKTRFLVARWGTLQAPAWEWELSSRGSCTVSPPTRCSPSGLPPRSQRCCFVVNGWSPAAQNLSFPGKETCIPGPLVEFR